MKKLVLFASTFLYQLSGFCYDYGRSYASDNIDWKEVFVAPVKDAFIEVVTFIPNILSAVCILLIGIGVAKILQVLVAIFLKIMDFDKLAQKIGVTDLIKGEKETVEAHKWFGSLVFWIAVLVSFVLSLGKLNLRIASVQLDRLLGFTFSIFAIMIIFIAGMVLSFIVSKIIKTVAGNVGFKKPELIGSIAKIVVLVATGIICLIEIGMPAKILLTAVSIIFCAVCLVLVISFGVGGITAASKFLDKIIDKN